MQQNNWNVEFSWVKAHIGIQGNETADRLAKEAAESRNIVECYSKIPKSVITSELKSKSEQKWQKDRDQTTKVQYQIILAQHFGQAKTKTNTKFHHNSYRSWKY